MLNYKNIEHFNLKILADIPCQIIIDNAYKGDVCPDSLEKILLSKGEYWVQLVAIHNSAYKVECVVNLDCDKVVRVNILSQISDADIVYDSFANCYRNVVLNINITQGIYEDGLSFLNGTAIV